jgi:hypothetical protein
MEGILIGESAGEVTRDEIVTDMRVGSSRTLTVEAAWVAPRPAKDSTKGLEAEAFVISLRGRGG